MRLATVNKMRAMNIYRRNECVSLRAIYDKAKVNVNFSVQVWQN